MRYYGLYKITNLINGKMYIGKHVTSNLDDGYMGSGKIIQKAIKKYGIESFRKEWLGFYEDEEELNYMERVFVDETWISREDTYNLCLGGEGGSAHKGKKHSENTKRIIQQKAIGRKMSRETKNKIRFSSKNKWKDTAFRERQHNARMMSTVGRTPVLKIKPDTLEVEAEFKSIRIAQL